MKDNVGEVGKEWIIEGFVCFVKSFIFIRILENFRRILI